MLVYQPFKMRFSHSFTLLTLILILFSHVDAALDGIQAGPSRLPTPPPTETDLVSDTDRIARLPSSSEFQIALKTESPWPWSPSNPPWVPHPNPDPRTRDKQWIIKRFKKLDDGREFGPLPVGLGKFSPEKYPLNMPWLENMYSRGEFKHENFEHYTHGGKFIALNSIFRPEPQILTQIQNRIHAALRFNRWEATLVTEGKGGVREGEYLWPPVKPLHSTEGLGLEVPYKVRNRLQHETLTGLNAHSKDNPVAWHMTIPTRRGGERHVMMTKANAAEFVQGGESIGDRNFWVFHEALQGKWDEPKLAMLGGMYLPKGAEGQLKEAGFAKPAFENILSRMH